MSYVLNRGLTPVIGLVTLIRLGPVSTARPASAEPRTGEALNRALGAL